MARELRGRTEEACDGFGELGVGEDEVFGAEGVVGDEEAEEVADVGEEGGAGGGEDEWRI